MYAINGFNFRDEALAKKMNELTRHRGPDDTGIFLSDFISLGHNRLSIIDLSKAGHQPMFNPNKTLAIVYNGELFNFKELREELRVLGHQFVSESDTEVVLAAYEEWGGKCLHRFNGIFAFAVLHIRTGKVFLARDRLGVNPFNNCVRCSERARG